MTDCSHVKVFCVAKWRLRFLSRPRVLTFCLKASKEKDDDVAAVQALPGFGDDESDETKFDIIHCLTMKFGEF